MDKIVSNFVAMALVVVCSALVSHGAEVGKGEELFRTKKCMNCHNLTVKKKVGPGLLGVSKRHSAEWLYEWLSNPQKVWEGDHSETTELKKWMKGKDKKKETAMKIEQLTPDEILAILDFLKKNDE